MYIWKTICSLHSYSVLSWLRQKSCRVSEPIKTLGTTKRDGCGNVGSTYVFLGIGEITSNIVLLADSHWFTPTSFSWGWNQFIELATLELKDPKNGFIVNDCCLLEVEISVQAVV
ncbi:hypothetical protein ACS0TY_025782 [Phlomoides rotata]